MAADLVGRTDELHRIGEMVHRLAVGRGSLALLLGEAGMGRTSLLREAIAMVGREVPRVRAVHVPAGMLRPGSVPTMGTIISTSTAAAPVADVLGGALHRDGLSLDSPELLEAAIAVVRAETTERPLLVTLDDLPFQDETALRALTSLAAAIVTMPVMVVITCRDMPSQAYESSPVGPLWVHRLAPLPVEDCIELVRRAAGAHVPHSVAAGIGRLTGGNPGDMRQLCGLLDDAQLSGMEPLPDPLPGTPVSAAVYGPWWEALDHDDRGLVLRAALAIVPELGALNAPATSGTTLLRGPNGRPVLEQGGDRVVFRAPRAASAVLALTPAAEIRDAHAVLAAAAAEGAPERHWHQLLAGGAPTPEALAALADLAEEALSEGDLPLVQRVTTGVVNLAAARDVPGRLPMTGGLGALYSGLPGSAVTLLADAAATTTDACEEHRALASLILARTYRDCAIPVPVVEAAISRL